MKFSERQGLVIPKNKLQIDDIDYALSTRLWNIIIDDFFEGMEYGKREFAKAVWKDELNRSIIEIPKDYQGFIDIKKFILQFNSWYQLEAKWYQKYELVEYVINYLSINNQRQYIKLFTSKFNKALELENSGYRLLNNVIVPITSELELASIENILKSDNKWKSVQLHIDSALTSLSDRENPNYRNSIKESISAIESVCQIITGEKASLGKTLNMLKRSYSINNALISGFRSIYGYTSDADGIRHALSNEDSKVTFEEAKFMLVACSAFSYYLMSKLGYLAK